MKRFEEVCARTCLRVVGVGLVDRLEQVVGAVGRGLVVRDGYQVMLISTGGTVIKIPVEDVKRLGRSTQGVIVMRLRGDDERVSSLALVMESTSSAEEDTSRKGDGTALVEPAGAADDEAPAAGSDDLLEPVDETDADDS